MHTPVGKCFRKTQFDVLLIFCPPAPDPRTNFSNSAPSTIPSAVIRASSAAILSAVIGFCTPAASPGNAEMTRADAIYEDEL